MGTYEDWQKNVAPYLQIIESRAGSLARETRQLVPFVRHIASKPAVGFTTKAEHELEQAEHAATELLQSIQDMRAQYRGARVVEPNPTWAAYEAELQAAG